MSAGRSRHQIATEIAKRYTQEGTGYADRLYQLAFAIEAALKERDERAAGIVLRARENETGPYLNAIAAAIRNEDTSAA